MAGDVFSPNPGMGEPGSFQGPAILLSASKFYINISERGSKLLAPRTKAIERETKKSRPATTPEAREDQMISLAVDLAEKQLRDGSASSQVVTHFLKLASSKERLEKEIMTQQKELITAKTEAIKSAKRVEEMYANALDAMRRYSGNTGGEDHE